jgi:hypothetical protein
MLPDGITIDEALAKACRIAQKAAPRGTHRDEADTAAGWALALVARRYSDHCPAAFWNLVRLRARQAMNREHRRAMRCGVHDVPKGASRVERELDYDPGRQHDPDLKLDAKTMLDRFHPTDRMILRAISEGHTHVEIGASLGVTGNAITQRLKVARRVALAS